MLLHLTALAARGVSACRQSPMLSATALRYACRGAETPSPIRQASLPSGGAANEVRAGDQLEDGEADRPDGSTVDVNAGGHGDQVTEKNQAAMPGLN